MPPPLLLLVARGLTRSLKSSSAVWKPTTAGMLNVASLAEAGSELPGRSMKLALNTRLVSQSSLHRVGSLTLPHTSSSGSTPMLKQHGGRKCSIKCG